SIWFPRDAPGMVEATKRQLETRYPSEEAPSNGPIASSARAFARVMEDYKVSVSLRYCCMAFISLSRDQGFSSSYGGQLSSSSSTNCASLLLANDLSTSRSLFSPLDVSHSSTMLRYISRSERNR